LGGAALPKREFVRFDVLDFYRYAGAIFVALDHFSLLYLPVPASTSAYMHDHLQPLMGFFFTLSGFVIMHIYDGKISSPAKYLIYMQKRLARIYPLHLLTLVMAIIWGEIAREKALFPPEAIIPNVLLVHAWDTTDQLTFDYPSWSVSAEFFVYLLFPIFLAGVNRLGEKALLLPLLGAAIIGLFFKISGSGSWTHATFEFGCLRAVPSFVAGMVIYRLATTRFAELVVPGWLAHGLAIATIPMMLLGVPNELVLAVFVLVVLLLALSEPAHPGVLSRPLPRALANCSYGFYLLHAFVGAAILGVVPKYLHLPDAWKFALVPIALILTTATAMLSFRVFENPARLYLGALRFRRSNLVLSPLQTTRPAVGDIPLSRAEIESRHDLP
jgi:peptidoglycan/LPS O-acetylase OafA/YrhL